jgi:hypothetical protein
MAGPGETLGSPWSPLAICLGQQQEQRQNKIIMARIRKRMPSPRSRYTLKLKFEIITDIENGMKPRDKSMKCPHRTIHTIF